MPIPKLTTLKNIPTGFKYYIPFSTDNIKIEPEIKDQYEQSKGYRIWVNLNAKASIKKYSIFTVPVIKKKGKLVVRYEFYEEFYEKMLNYLIKYWENEKNHLSLSEIRNELAKKIPEKEFSLLYSRDFSNYVERSAQSIQQKIQENPTVDQIAQFQELREIAQLKLLDMKEEELLSMEDFSQMNFNMKKSSNKNLTKIINYLSNVGLSQEQENKIYSYLEINRLVDGMPLQKEGKHGVLLYGPPGTGKTTTMSAFFKVFEELGCSVFEVNAQKLVSRPVVGAFAAEISKQIFEPAIEKIIKKQMPCLVYVDEATALVSKPKTSGVSDWYQEGLDTLKNYMNRSKYPGIILCLATNSRLSDLDETIVGDNGRLEAVYFDFLNEEQFKILWKDKLKNNLNLKKEELENWISKGHIDLLSKISANSVSGRFVANFCSKYREQNISNALLSGIKGLIYRRDSGKNLTKESEKKGIDFWKFYENYLKKLKTRLDDEIKNGTEEIKNDHYFTLEERNAKIEELKNKNSIKLKEIEEELRGFDLHSEEEIKTPKQKDKIDVIDEVDNAFNFLKNNLHLLRKNTQKDFFRNYLNSLVIIYKDLEKYREEKELRKLDYKILNTGFKSCFKILGKYAGVTEEVEMGQTEFEFVERFITTLLNYQNN